MHWDWTVHLGEIIGGISFGVAVLRKLDRLIVVFEEYPPHRHAGNTIIYPKGQEPGITTQLQERA